MEICSISISVAVFHSGHALVACSSIRPTGITWKTLKQTLFWERNFVIEYICCFTFLLYLFLDTFVQKQFLCPQSSFYSTAYDFQLRSYSKFTVLQLPTTLLLKHNTGFFSGMSCDEWEIVCVEGKERTLHHALVLCCTSHTHHQPEISFTSCCFRLFPE